MRKYNMAEVSEKHDEIVKWVDVNTREVLSAAFGSIGGDYGIRKKVWEYPLEDRGRVKGYIDLWVHNNADLVFCVEVKSYIASVGALIGNYILATRWQVPAYLRPCSTQSAYSLNTQRNSLPEVC